MEFYQTVYNRRTIRDFEGQGIDADIIKKMLDAGLQAPSNDHMRNWHFVIVKDRVKRIELIGKIHKTISDKEIECILNDWEVFDSCQRAMYFDGIPKQYSMLLNAGALIIPCFQQKKPLLESKTLNELNGFASIWCCIENVLLAAAAEGIYGVTRIPFPEELPHIKKVLRIPDDYEIPCYIALGYPTKDSKPIKQLPINVDDRMHDDEW